MAEKFKFKKEWDDEANDQELPEIVPAVVFKTRVRDDSIEGPNPFRWEDKTTYDYFAGKRVVLFSLPGAFTPTCSTYQLPGFEKNFAEFKALGIKDIYCVSVNDSFPKTSIYPFKYDAINLCKNHITSYGAKHLQKVKWNSL
jgi:hypothetical protein